MPAHAKVAKMRPIDASQIVRRAGAYESPKETSLVIMNRRLFVLAAAFALAACTASPASAAPTGPAPRGAVVQGLRAEIVPTIGGLFASSPADPDGKPVRVPWVLRVTNTTDAPIVLRTGGDDESIEIDARGAGVKSVFSKEPCPEYYAYGKKNVIPAKGTVDVPIIRLASGARCNQTARYLTAPGLYSIDVTLNGHIHSSAATGTTDRGTPVRLDAPTITIKAS